MAESFTENVLQQLEIEFQTVSRKHDRLCEAYVNHNFADARANEYALHGFTRRLRTLVRCISKIYEILPPRRDDIPTDEEISDVKIYLQAFIINVFGCVDNLAWIWVCEKNVMQRDGMPIPYQQVGLRSQNRLVHNSLSPEYREYVNGLNDWFANLENYRHALAHRIPLYVPPYQVIEENEAAYRELDARKQDALNHGDVDKYDFLSAEQDALCIFQPIMIHSFIENSQPVLFHPQLLADFNTIEELGRKMLEELDGAA